MMSARVAAVARTEPLLETCSISKRYGAQHALRDVSIDVGVGEVVGLIGENGAGKSTLLDVISGVTVPDSGRLSLMGEEVRPRSYREASDLGIFRVFQNLSLVPSASVYENLFLAHEDYFLKFGVLQHRKMRMRAAETLERFGHGWIDPSARVSSYEFATRQIIEIVKCFALADLLEVDRPLLLLDEPTTSLAEEEVDFFRSLVDRVRVEAGIVFVSHRVGEVSDLCDRAYVLRDGEIVGSQSRDQLHADTSAIRLMGRGESRKGVASRRRTEIAGEPVLEVSGLSSSRRFTDIQLNVRAGEILGLAGVVGSGRGELLRVLAGDATASTGSVRIEGQHTAVTRAAVGDRVRARVSYVPPDRASEGLFADAPITHNVTVCRLVRGLSGRPFLKVRDERRVAREQVASLAIKTRSIDVAVRRLSGGNAQKVMLARSMAAEARLLLLDNPTAGIDVDAKREIYATLQAFADEGGAVLVSSNELSELLTVCDRIVFMRDGEITAEQDRVQSLDLTEEDLLIHMV